MVNDEDNIMLLNGVDAAGIAQQLADEDDDHRNIRLGQHVGHDEAWLEEQIMHHEFVDDFPDYDAMGPQDYNNVVAAAVADFYGLPSLDLMPEQ